MGKANRLCPVSVFSTGTALLDRAHLLLTVALLHQAGCLSYLALFHVFLFFSEILKGKEEN